MLGAGLCRTPRASTFRRAWWSINKPGASGAIGWADVINGKPDGYKVVLLATDLMTQPNMGLTKITYEDFTPIARLNYDPAAITVRADAPWNTVEEFIAAAKKGEFRIGNGGNGSTWHLAAAAVEDKTGVEVQPHPVRGAAPAALSLLGGHIDAITVSAAEVYTYVAAGKLKTLGGHVGAAHQGLREGADAEGAQHGHLDRHLARPGGGQGHAAEVVAILRAATAKIAKEQSLRDALDKQNMGYAYADGDAFGAVMAKDHAFYKTLIAKLGLKPSKRERRGAHACRCCLTTASPARWSVARGCPAPRPSRRLVVFREDGVYDLSQTVPTMSDLLEMRAIRSTWCVRPGRSSAREESCATALRPVRPASRGCWRRATCRSSRRPA